ncbi:MAG: cytochrome P450, partial [Pseudomonadota bacterium]|nr:cytochrome P450 [Pseudomonadota bacterium]
CHTRSRPGWSTTTDGNVDGFLAGAAASAASAVASPTIRKSVARNGFTRGARERPASAAAAPLAAQSTTQDDISARYDRALAAGYKALFLCSAIANAEIDGEPLSDEFLDGSWLLIVFAGNDTTRNSLSGTMKLITENMSEREKLMANPKLFPNFVNEAVRMVSPVTYMRRTVTQDTNLGGQALSEGDKVVMYYAAANRDPDKFENPNTFDIERANANEHLAFGNGPHVCLGKRVAIMQLESAYQNILRRFPRIRWTGNATLAPSNFVHAISSLEVDLGA